MIRCAKANLAKAVDRFTQLIRRVIERIGWQYWTLNIMAALVIALLRLLPECLCRRVDAFE